MSENIKFDGEFLLRRLAEHHERQRRDQLQSIAEIFEEVGAAAQLYPLDRPIDFQRLCLVCQSEQQFRAGWECVAGLAGYCLGCGEELVIPYSRAS